MNYFSISMHVYSYSKIVSLINNLNVHAIFFPDISCPTPPDIANALKISDGVHNGSVTMYACFPDYVASNAANTIVCNETSWTLTNFSCSLGISYKFIFVTLRF